MLLGIIMGQYLLGTPGPKRKLRTKGAVASTAGLNDTELVFSSMAPKRTLTSAAPAMTQAVIRQLVADSVVAALKVFIGGLPHSIKGTVTASKP
ncbi:hypothetical protein Tco_1254608 [Tanacetum coccineum]